MKLLPAQTSTVEAQTNKTIRGEFGVCGGGGGLSDLRITINIILIYKKLKQHKLKFLQHKCSTNDWDYFGDVLRWVGGQLHRGLYQALKAWWN